MNLVEESIERFAVPPDPHFEIGAKRLQDAPNRVQDDLACSTSFEARDE